jgi:hypothetical protein
MLSVLWLYFICDRYMSHLYYYDITNLDCYITDVTSFISNPLHSKLINLVHSL